jgi:hypothetical protein
VEGPRGEVDLDPHHRRFDAITKTVSTRLHTDEPADAFVARARALGAAAAEAIADPPTNPELVRAERI